MGNATTEGHNGGNAATAKHDATNYSVPSIETDAVYDRKHAQGDNEIEPPENCSGGQQKENKDSEETSSLGTDVETKEKKVPGKLTVEVDKVPQSKSDAPIVIDRDVRQNSIESDRAYREITKDIIKKTSEQLTAHTNAKKPLRTVLMWFVIALLAVQFIVLGAVLFLNQVWTLEISDFVINVYIVSLFVETLAGLIIMIKFAFDSTQEVELIKILNAIILHFKKYDDK